MYIHFISESGIPITGKNIPKLSWENTDHYGKFVHIPSMGNFSLNIIYECCVHFRELCCTQFMILKNCVWQCCSGFDFLYLSGQHNESYMICQNYRPTCIWSLVRNIHNAFVKLSHNIRSWVEWQAVILNSVNIDSL